MNYGRTYYCRVKFIDTTSEESKWSETIKFTIETDEDNDGIPNRWKSIYDLTGLNDISPLGDPDGDDIVSWYEYYLGLDPNANDAKTSSGIYPAVFGSIIDDRSNNNVDSEIKILSDAGVSFPTPGTDGNYLNIHPSGVFDFFVVADSYYPRVFKDIEILEGNTHQQDFVLFPMPTGDIPDPYDQPEPEPVPIDDDDSNGGGGGGCFISVLSQ